MAAFSYNKQTKKSPSSVGKEIRQDGVWGQPVTSARYIGFLNHTVGPDTAGRLHCNELITDNKVSNLPSSLKRELL